MARYTVKQVATLSGVSVRTLHYYDQLGLLKPTDVGPNGYRYYDRPALLRLQQILFFRDLGLSLAQIGETIDAPAFDAVAALRQHRKFVEQELTRHHQLIRTIDETIQELCGDKDMIETNPLKGFSPEKQRAYEGELIARFGDGAEEKIAQSKRSIGKMSAAQLETIKAEGDQINKDLVVAVNADKQPEDADVQKLIARHYAWVCNYWVPDREAYIGLGEYYLDHVDFRAFYEAYDDRLVAFLAAGMKVYAEVNL